MTVKNTLTYNSAILNSSAKRLIFQTPGANVIKLFTALIYCHFKVILSLCIIELYCHVNYCGMSVNYLDIFVTNVIF